MLKWTWDRCKNVYMSVNLLYSFKSKVRIPLHHNQYSKWGGRGFHLRFEYRPRAGGGSALALALSKSQSRANACPVLGWLVQWRKEGRDCIACPLKLLGPSAAYLQLQPLWPNLAGPGPAAVLSAWPGWARTWVATTDCPRDGSRAVAEGGRKNGGMGEQVIGGGGEQAHALCGGWGVEGVQV